MDNLLQPIPADATAPARLIEILNDRLRRITAALGSIVLTDNVDANGFRIVNLGNAVDLTDSLNDADARRLIRRGPAVVNQTIVQGQSEDVEILDRVINATGVLEIFDGTNPAQGTVFTSFRLPPSETASVFEVQFLIYDPPTGSSIIFDIDRSDDDGATWGASIFTAPPAIAIGSRVTIVRNLVTNPVVCGSRTRLRLKCSQVGSTFAGANMRCIILYRVIGI